MDPQSEHVFRFEKRADLQRDDGMEPAALDLTGECDALRANIDARIVHAAGQEVGLISRQVYGQPAVDRVFLKDLSPAADAVQIVVQRCGLLQHQVARFFLRLGGHRQGFGIETRHMLRGAIDD